MFCICSTRNIEVRAARLRHPNHQVRFWCFFVFPFGEAPVGPGSGGGQKRAGTPHTEGSFSCPIKATVCVVELERIRLVTLTLASAHGPLAGAAQEPSLGMPVSAGSEL